MAKRKTKTSRYPERERDSTYLLKLVSVIIFASLWLKIRDPVHVFGIPLLGVPVGTIIGIFVIHFREKIEQDRKIWYAILLLTTVVGLFLPIGILV